MNKLCNCRHECGKENEKWKMWIPVVNAMLTGPTAFKENPAGDAFITFFMAPGFATGDNGGLFIVTNGTQVWDFHNVVNQYGDTRKGITASIEITFEYTRKTGKLRIISV